MIPRLDSEVSLAERYVQINKYTSVIIIIVNGILHESKERNIYENSGHLSRGIFQMTLDGCCTNKAFYTVSTYKLCL